MDFAVAAVQRGRGDVTGERRRRQEGGLGRVVQFALLCLLRSRRFAAARARAGGEGVFSGEGWLRAR